MNLFYVSFIGFDTLHVLSGISDLLMKEKLQTFCRV